MEGSWWFDEPVGKVGGVGFFGGHDGVYLLELHL